LTGKVLFQKAKKAKVDEESAVTLDAQHPAPDVSEKADKAKSDQVEKANFGSKRATKPKEKVELSKALSKKNTTLLSFGDDEDEE
jgi:hypothetical protein